MPQHTEKDVLLFQMDCFVQRNTFCCQHPFIVLESEKRTGATVGASRGCFSMDVYTQTSRLSPSLHTHTHTHTHIHIHTPSHLSEWLIQLLQDALLIEHLSLVAVLVVIMDFLSEVCRKFVEIGRAHV